MDTLNIYLLSHVVCRDGRDVIMDHSEEMTLMADFSNPSSAWSGQCLKMSYPGRFEGNPARFIKKRVSKDKKDG